MKKNLLFVSLSVCSLPGMAQDNAATPLPNSFRINNQLDVSVGGSNKGWVESLSYRHVWGLGQHKQWRVGSGIRFSSFQGQDVEYRSAPPDFDGKAEKMDTLRLGSAQQNNLAILLTATYRLKNRLELGCNIDLVGYSFGAEKTGTLQTNGQRINTKATATQLTALLVGANDRGMLKAEFTAGYWVSEKVMLRVGVVSQNTEYKTTTEIQPGNSRFRNNAAIPFFAVTYSPRHN